MGSIGPQKSGRVVRQLTDSKPGEGFLPIEPRNFGIRVQAIGRSFYPIDSLLLGLLARRRIRIVPTVLAKTMRSLYSLV